MQGIISLISLVQLKVLLHLCLEALLVTLLHQIEFLIVPILAQPLQVLRLFLLSSTVLSLRSDGHLGLLLIFLAFFFQVRNPIFKFFLEYFRLVVR